MKTTLTCFAILAFAACKSAPEPRAEEPQLKAPPPVEEPRPVAQEADDGFRVSYRPQAEGRTLIEVTGPAGADVTIADGDAQVGQDKAPMSVEAVGDKYYRVTIAGREKKLAARSGQVASVQLVAATGPQPMARDAFKALVRELDLQGGDAGKLAMLKLALQTNYITTAMAGVLLEHLTYRQNKLDAVPLMKAKIVDRQNQYLLVDHFTYREDKAKVQELLQAP